MPIAVHEVTMAVPDIVRCEIRDPPISKGYIETLSVMASGTGTLAVTGCANNGAGLIRVECAAASLNSGITGARWPIGGVLGCTEANGCWTVTYVDATHFDLNQSTFVNAWTSGGTVVVPGTWRAGTAPASPASYPLAGQASYFLHIGPTGFHRRWQDVQNTEFLDRAAAIDHTGYGTIGGLTVTKATIKSEPYDNGEGVYGKTMSFKHMVYLKLSGNLAEGDHTIDFPAGTGLADYAFTFNDNLTRCSSIHVNQVGWKPTDTDKLAYLSQWAPGQATNGQIEFATAYGITAFDIINAAGKVVYSGSVALRVGPTDTDPSSAIPIPRIASSTITPLVITGVTKANPCVISYTGTDPSNGDFIYINHVIGMVQLNNTYGKVANVDTGANTFEYTTEAGVNVNSSAYTTWSSGGLVYITQAINHPGTYVYGLDFSDFEPAHHTYYRIKISGLGVSDPFLIDPAVWYQAVEAWGAGEYHQRNGTALDGRFGYTTPVSFKPGDDKTVYKSYLPAIWSSEGGAMGTTVSAALGANSTWRAPGTITNAWGGWKDAGDWDDFADNIHILTAWNLLDVYQILPSGAARDVSWGLPKSSAVRDPSLFAGTDSLGDLVHAAIWQIDFYRQMQNVDGSVPGGLQFSGSTSTFAMEPSWLNRSDIYAYLPDHIGTFCFAAGAAKAAKVLEDAGFTAAAAVFRASAIAAYNWSNALYTDNTARDAYYLDCKTRAGWSAGTYATNDATVQVQAKIRRNVAAASLFRLTGDTAYEDVLIDPTDGYSSWTSYGSAHNQAAWEYISTPGANASAVTTMKAQLVSRAVNMLTSYDGDSPYRTLKFANLNWEFGAGGTDLTNVLGNMIRCHQFTGDDKYLRVINAGFSYILGANQRDQCFTKGIGARNPNGYLHRDSMCQGDGYPMGLSDYGPCTVTGITQSLNFANNTLQYITEATDSTFASSYVPQRELSPVRGGWPTYEVAWESPTLIEVMEYTIEQTIIAYLMGGMYMQAQDGNTETELFGGRTRFVLGTPV